MLRLYQHLIFFFYNDKIGSLHVRTRDIPLPARQLASQFSLSITLLLRMWLLCSEEKSQYRSWILQTASHKLLVLALNSFSKFSRATFLDMVCVSFQNGVSQLHSTRDLQTMSPFIHFSICETYPTLSFLLHEAMR